jgi:nuclear pore complex protein Nup133
MQSVLIYFLTAFLRYAELVDACIGKVMQQRGLTEQPKEGLTYQDVFYREVSKVDDILHLMLVQEEESLFEDLPPATLVNLIASINSIICVSLQSFQ